MSNEPRKTRIFTVFFSFFFIFSFLGSRAALSTVPKAPNVSCVYSISLLLITAHCIWHMLSAECWVCNVHRSCFSIYKYDAMWTSEMKNCEKKTCNLLVIGSTSCLVRSLVWIAIETASHWMLGSNNNNNITLWAESTWRRRWIAIATATAAAEIKMCTRWVIVLINILQWRWCILVAVALYTNIRYNVRKPRQIHQIDWFTLHTHYAHTNAHEPSTQRTYIYSPRQLELVPSLRMWLLIGSILATAFRFSFVFIAMSFNLVCNFQFKYSVLFSFIRLFVRSFVRI